MFCISSCLNAQNYIQSGIFTPEQLVQNVFSAGYISVSNVQFHGDTSSIGYLTTNFFYAPFMDGLILSTGHAEDGNGPNNNTDFSSDLLQPGDSLLGTLIPGIQTYDACILEFDVIPFFDCSLQFSYRLASEEYPEYNDSAYSDVIGIFVTGPNPAGGLYNNLNLSVIPGSNIPVSVNTVNTIDHPAYFEMSPFIVSEMNIFIQYDGLTKVLTPSVPLTHCQTYHFKIGISDSGNPDGDSGLFLKANSFLPVNVPVPVHVILPVIYEGCTEQIVFTRPDTIGFSSPLCYLLEWSGSAIKGNDVPQLMDFVMIPAFQMTDTISFPVFMDGVAEGPEFIIVSLLNATQCNGIIVSDTVTIYDNVALTGGIIEHDTVIVDSSPSFYLLHTTASTPAEITHYHWNTNSTSANPYVALYNEGNNVFYVTITDDCGQFLIDSICITLEFPQDITLIPKFQENLWVPNAIRPGSPVAVNTVFLPIWSGIQPIRYYLVIFNRSGRVIFETSDPGKAWNGFDLEGKLAPSGVYPWKMVYYLPGKDRISRNGSLTVLNY